MRPDKRELDEEVRGHLASSIKERIERGENPEAARLVALQEFGHIPVIGDSMLRVRYSRWLDAVAALGPGDANRGRTIRLGARSATRSSGVLEPSVPGIVPSILPLFASAHPRPLESRTHLP